MSSAKKTNRFIHVAIVGSGPSAFYAAESLQKSKHNINIHMFEKCPFPYGLVRYGVAPDHEKIKSVTKIFDRIAQNEHFRFWGNVHIGQDLTLEDLKKYYDIIIVGCGSSLPKTLPIPHIDLEGSISATEFVAWYNSHPDSLNESFDLTASTVVIVGQGNVALDIARILAKDPSELSQTDISGKALNALQKSRIESIHLVGRRGFVHSAFSLSELKDLATLSNCELIIRPEDLAFSEEDMAFIEASPNKEILKKIHFLKDYMNSFSKQSNGKKKIIFEFFKTPFSLDGNKKVEKVLWKKNLWEGSLASGKSIITEEILSTECQLFIRSIGYYGMPLDTLPFDEKRGIIPNKEGRVNHNPFFYVVGWIKRGPQGLIGTNKQDSYQTVSAVLEDIEQLPLSSLEPFEHLENNLKEKNIRFFSYQDWMKMDIEEQKRGKLLGKIREKFQNINDIITFLDGIN